MFVCTGTEANDLALRIARAATGNQGVIVTEHAYHGNSTAVHELSTADYPATDRPPNLEAVPAPCSYRGPYGGSDSHVALQTAGQLETAIERLEARGYRPALFICDTAFSSNGVLTPAPEYLREAYRRIRAAGGLAVADEVQAGLFRLGDHYWGFQDSGVVPDIVTMGKPLGDGHPLAVVVTTPHIAGQFARKSDYFNTFGGNPVSAAVGLAVLDVIEQQQILRNVQNTGRQLGAGLKALPAKHEAVGDVRGKGLFYGVEIVSDPTTREPAPKAAARVREDLRSNGVLVGTTGPFDNVIKIRPPLVFNSEHVALLLDALDRSLATVNPR
jgi:4-aminobutyrate aminotransferase-like enzyme